jgi:hypothetical protein
VNILGIVGIGVSIVGKFIKNPLSVNQARIVGVAIGLCSLGYIISSMITTSSMGLVPSIFVIVGSILGGVIIGVIGGRAIKKHISLSTLVGAGAGFLFADLAGSGVGAIGVIVANSITRDILSASIDRIIGNTLDNIGKFAISYSQDIKTGQKYAKAMEESNRLYHNTYNGAKLKIDQIQEKLYMKIIKEEF